MASGPTRRQLMAANGFGAEGEMWPIDAQGEAGNLMGPSKGAGP